MLRRLASVAAALALLGGVAVAVATPDGGAAATTSTQESYRVPAGRVFTVDGRGFGHGYGMSQWGMAQAAVDGATDEQILNFYYPGTTDKAAGKPTVRVALTGTGNGTTSVGYGGSGSNRFQCSDSSQQSTYCWLDVDQTSGLVVTDAATGGHPTLSGATRWRATVTANGLWLRGLVSGSWKTATIGGKSRVAGPVTFSGPKFIKVDYGSTQRDYRGVVSAVRTSPSGQSPARMVRLDTIGLDDYTRGVLCREAECGWHLAALEAQAVATRSYTMANRADSRSQGLPYDICDSTYCQVFGGSRLYSGGSSTWLEPTSGDTADSAITATADTIRVLSDGTPLFAEFSASNGGWTAGGDPGTYTTPKYDTWDDHSADPDHRWTATLSASYLEQRYGFARLDRLVVTSRDGTKAQWGGRVRSVDLVGVDAQGASMTVSLSSQWSLYFGMRSTFWRIRTVAVHGPAKAARDSTVTVTGWGNPGSAVQVYLRRQNDTAYSKIATVTAGSDGSYATSVPLTTDASYYATSDGAKSSTRSIAVTGTTLTGPATAPLGTDVHLTGYAEPGSTVTLYLRRSNATGYTAGGTTTAAADGSYALSYLADGDYSYYTQAAGVKSPTVSTKAVVTFTGPAKAARASHVTLHGQTLAGAAVTVYRRAQNWSSFRKVAGLTAGADGRFSLRYRATVDAKYYALSAGRRSATGTTRAVGTTVYGPASARKGTWVKVTGYAAPGSTVTLYVKQRNWSSYRARPTVAASSSGWWKRYYYCGNTATYYAVAAGRTSTTRTTTAG